MRLGASVPSGYSLFLVVGQFLALAGVIFSGPWLPTSGVAWGLVTLGVGLGGWAWWCLRGSFRVLPDPHPRGVLVTRGPYRYIRHPMYTALLVATLGLVWEAPSGLRLGAWLALASVLVAKLRYEERLLCKQYPEAYPRYREQTWCLLPGVY